MIETLAVISIVFSFMVLRDLVKLRVAITDFKSQVGHIVSIIESERRTIANTHYHFERRLRILEGLEET